MTTYNLKTDSAQIYNDLGIAGLSDSDFEITIKKINPARTDQQRKAIELYSKMMAEGLNDAGFSFTAFVEYVTAKGIDFDWTQELFKEHAWKVMQGPILPHTINDKGKVTTTKLNTAEVSKVYDQLNRSIIEWTGGFSIQFPSAR